MEVQIAISKIKKYATSSSGDTAEVIERPNGGMSVVLADGQSSGKGAKWVSSLVVRKVIQFLADGVSRFIILCENNHPVVGVFF